MRPFKYTRASNTPSAINLLSKNVSAKFLAGGTNLIDLMKEDVERPNELVDISQLSSPGLKLVSAEKNNGFIVIDGFGKNSETANHPIIRQNLPLLTQAILAGASAQIRNMASNGGNLLQRTRCSYFYDVNMPCNKREPGTGCGALEGINRMHAIFGWSEKCIAVYPSDMAIALSALDAVVKVQTVDGKERSILFNDFHRLPGDAPEIDNNLKAGELITSIELPKNNFANHSYYLKVRDRASYAFALISVATGLELKGKQITKAKISLGGVAHKPWKALEAERFLLGKEANTANFTLAAEAEMKNAKPFEHNKFKVELCKKSIVLALEKALVGNRA